MRKTLIRELLLTLQLSLEAIKKFKISDCRYRSIREEDLLVLEMKEEIKPLCKMILLTIHLREQCR